MLQRKKSSYIEVKLVQNSKYLEEIWKTKSLGLNAKEGSTTKWYNSENNLSLFLTNPFIYG